MAHRLGLQLGPLPMSQLVDFYRGTGTDSRRRSLDEILSWDDEQLELVHDFIQWLFPLPERSQFNPNAPLLTPSDIDEFRSDERLRAQVRRSYERILAFLGLTLAGDGKVTEGANFAASAPDVWQYPNHNWLRITRILRSLKLLGLETEANALFAKLSTMYASRRFPITVDTFQYWEDAISERTA